MYRELYKALTPYDWYVLWRYFFAMAVLLVGVGSVTYSTIIKLNQKKWSNKSLKKHTLISCIIGFSFGTSFVWANAFFDSPEMTGFIVPIQNSVFFIIGIGIGVSLMMRVFLIRYTRYFESYEQNPQRQRKRQEKLLQTETQLKEKHSLTNESEIKLMAEQKLLHKEIIVARVCFALIFGPILTMFFPHVFIIILYKIGAWSP